MSRRSRRTVGVPDERESLLLRICFLPPDGAATLWDERGSRLPIEELDPEAHGLLPLLHRRLLELDRRPPSLERLQGIRRRLWVQNEVRLRSAGVALDALAAADVRGALAGGAGVLVGELRRLDLRPLHEVDIVVSDGQAQAASDALVRSGWRTGPSWRDGFLLDVHATPLTDRDGRSVVVRSSASAPYADALDHARTVSLAAGTFGVLDHADLLLHVLLDGARALPGARVRWASDALVLVGGGEVAWERVATAARARHADATVAAALAQLDRLVPLGLPAGTLPRLAPAPRRRWEHLLGADAAGPTTVLRAHARRSTGSGPGRAALDLPAWFCEAWSVPTIGGLAPEAARRVLGRLAHRVRTS